MAASITVHLQIFKCPHFPHFKTNLDETGIKFNGLLRSFRAAVPFKIYNDGNELNMNPVLFCTFCIFPAIVTRLKNCHTYQTV